MYRSLKTMIALSALWAGTAGAAPPGLTGAEQAAVDACFELEDERAAVRCLDQLALPLPPKIQNMVDLLLDPAVGTALERWQTAADAATAAHAAELAARDTPRDLLAAVMLAQTVAGPSADGEAPMPTARAAEWFDAARRATPADPLVAWMEATSCATPNLGCDPTAATGRLLQVDGDNAAVQLLALQVAHAAGDRVAARAHLTLAAQAGRFEPHDRALLRLLVDARAGIALPPLSAEVNGALDAAFGPAVARTPGDVDLLPAVSQWGSSLVPLQALPAICGETGALDAATRQDCIAVLEPIARNRNMAVYPALALDLLVQLEPRDSRWREELRQHAWLYQQAMPLLPRLPGTSVAAHARQLADSGEVGAWEALLRKEGIALAPPRGWLPDNPRRRSLITTGRPPAG